MRLLQNIKTTCVILTSLFVFSACDSTENEQQTPADNPIEIQETLTLGGTKNESGQSVVNTSDGGYAILGYT